MDDRAAGWPPPVDRWLGAEPQALQTLDQAMRRVERWASLAEADPTDGVWCLTLRASGVPVVTVLLLPLAGGEVDGEVEVGWHLHAAGLFRSAPA